MKPAIYALTTVFVGVFLFAGCTPSVPSTKPDAGKPAPSSKKPEPAKPAPTAPKLVPTGPNLLYNGSFEYWDNDGVIKAWNLSEGSGKNWLPVKGSKITEKIKNGQFAIELPLATAADKSVILAQSIVPDKVAPGKRIALSAWVNSPDKGAVHMVLTYMVAGKENVVRCISRGLPEWDKIAVEQDVPQQADATSFRIQFIVKSPAKSPVRLDDVRMQTMAPSKPAPEKKPADAAAAPQPPAATPTPPPDAAPKADAAAPQPPATPAPSPDAAPKADAAAPQPPATPAPPSDAAPKADATPPAAPSTAAADSAKNAAPEEKKAGKSEKKHSSKGKN